MNSTGSGAPAGEPIEDHLSALCDQARAAWSPGEDGEPVSVAVLMTRLRRAKREARELSPPADKRGQRSGPTRAA